MPDSSTDQTGAGQEQSRILVIKLGALGDFIYALGPMQAIRRHHPHARITLLTRPAYAGLGERSGLFDTIWNDSEPKPFNLPGVLSLRAKLTGTRFDRVYDLQTSDRTGFYYRLFWPGPKPEWSGIVPGCSNDHHYSRQTLTHTQDRHALSLVIAEAGEHVVVLGGDHPYTPPQGGIPYAMAEVDAMGVSSELKRKIERENALNLLGKRVRQVAGGV